MCLEDRIKVADEIKFNEYKYKYERLKTMGCLDGFGLRNSGVVKIEAKEERKKKE